MNRPKLQIIYFATAMSLVNLGDTLFYVIVPTYYTELGLIPFQVGILLSVNRWIRLATNYPVEYCYRCHPSDLWLLGAFALGSATCILYGIAHSFYWFLLARIGWGITYSFLRQAGIMHVVSFSSERTLAEQMGYFTGINSLWRTSGLFLGALCHDLLGFTRTFLGIGILSLLSLPLIRLSQRHSKVSDKEAVPDSGKDGHGVFFSLGAVMGLVGGGMITSTLGLILKTMYGDSFTFTGIVLGAATLTGFVMAMRHLIDGVVGPVLGAVADRVGHGRTTGMLFLLGSGLLVVLGLQEKILVLIIVIAAYFTCATALYTVLYAQSGQSGSRAVASFATAMDLGMSIGPMIGWGIAQWSLPLASIFMIAASVYAVGAAVSFGMLGKSPRGRCSLQEG